MPSKHTVSRVDPGLPQPDNTLNDELLNADAVTSPDDSLETEDSLTGEAVKVSPHEASEAGTGALTDRKTKPALDDEDMVERTGRAPDLEEGDVLDPSVTDKAKRRLH